MNIAPPRPLHACFSGDPTCSGCRPCQACAREVCMAVIPGALMAVGLNSPETAEQFFDGYAASFGRFYQHQEQNPQVRPRIIFTDMSPVLPPPPMQQAPVNPYMQPMGAPMGYPQQPPQQHPGYPPQGPASGWQQPAPQAAPQPQHYPQQPPPAAPIPSSIANDPYMQPRRAFDQAQQPQMQAPQQAQPQPAPAPQPRPAPPQQQAPQQQMAPQAPPAQPPQPPPMRAEEIAATASPAAAASPLNGQGTPPRSGT